MASTARVRASSLTSASKRTLAVPASWLAVADRTPGTFSRAPFTAASQCSHIMPVMRTVFSARAGFSSTTGASGRSTGCFFPRSRAGSYSLNKFSRRALVTTQKLDKLMAAAPIMGFSVTPSFTKAPAARGMQMLL